MPRCPARDFADRCESIRLLEEGLCPSQIAQVLHRLTPWVSRSLKRYDPQIGLESRPHHCPKKPRRRWSKPFAS